MAKQTINLGTAPTGVGGDTPRSAFTKAQGNFDELYTAVAAAFGKGNILGTVSQVNGVPTGAVIERGSNSSGQYVRFADGTQICWGSSPGATANNAAASGVYFSGLITVGYPIAPGPTAGYLSLVSHSSGATATLQWMAVGRWF
jgi:hypothetical protein